MTRDRSLETIGAAAGHPGRAGGDAAVARRARGAGRRRPDAEAAGRRRRVRAPAAGLPAHLDVRRRPPRHPPPADDDRREAGDRPARDPDAGVGRRLDRPHPDVRAGVAESIADPRLPRAVDGDAAGGEGGAGALAGAPARAVARAADRRRVDEMARRVRAAARPPRRTLDRQRRRRRWRRASAPAASTRWCWSAACRPSRCSRYVGACAEAGVPVLLPRAAGAAVAAAARRRTSRPSAAATTSSTSRASWRRACWRPRRSSIACWRPC